MKNELKEISRTNSGAGKANYVFTRLAWLLAACIVIQVFLAGLALFWDSAGWASHAGFSRVLMIPPVLMLVTSIIARLPVSLRLRSLGLVGMIALMFVTAKLSPSIGYLSALHPVIAMIMLGQTLSIARKSIEVKEENRA